MDDGRQHLLTRKPSQRNMLGHLRPDGRQRLGESREMLKFDALSHLSKHRMIAILLTPFGVAPGRLNMAVLKSTNPYFRSRAIACAQPPADRQAWRRSVAD